MNTNTGSIQQQLLDIYVNLGGVMAPGQNSNSYSVQGWLAKIAELTENGVVSPERITTPGGVIWRFSQIAAPDTRGGAALVNGDLWYNPATGHTAFRYGGRWLSAERHILNYVVGSNITTTGGSNADMRLPPDAFLDGWTLSLDAVGTHDALNNVALGFNVQSNGGAVLVNSTLVRSPYWASHTSGDIIYEVGVTDPSIVSNIPFTQFPNPNPAQSVLTRAAFNWTITGVAPFSYSFNLWYRRILG